MVVECLISTVRTNEFLYNENFIYIEFNIRIQYFTEQTYLSVELLKFNKMKHIPISLPSNDKTRLKINFAFFRKRSQK